MAGIDAIMLPDEVAPLRVTATLYVVPAPVTTFVFVPPAVPVIVTSALVKSATDLLKTTAKFTLLELVGSACPPA